ncbi:MAG: hypothetical protein ACFFCM_17610 [Promethearchaeota archaeon]
MVEIRDFKQDKKIISRFLALSPESDNITEDIIGAWRRVVGGRKSIALNLYKELLSSKKGEFTEKLSEKLNEPIHNIRRSLNDLKAIGLVEKKKRKRNRVLSDFWRIKEKVDGLLRLIPIEEKSSSSAEEEVNWFLEYKKLAKIFTEYTGYAWILNKKIQWKIEKDGVMDYKENRKYLKLSNVTPSFNYITLYAKEDPYNLEITDQNNNDLKEEEQTYGHPNEKLEIVNAVFSKDIIRNNFIKMNIGESYNITIADRKRLYACPKTKNIHMACFLYQISIENIDTLELFYQIHKNIHPMSCGIWYDNHKEFEINLSSETSQNLENITWNIKENKNYVDFYWKGEFLMKKVRILKFLFELEPQYESDHKQWIKMYEAIDCPFCHKIPFETIGRI